MSTIEKNEIRLTLNARSLTVAAFHVLARIYTWEVRIWRPKSNRRAALIVLNDPPQSSVNPRVVASLMDAGLVDGINDTLVVTAAGVKTLLERPDIMARMRASGAI